MIYLDHAATTPLHESVREAMVPWLADGYGNASSSHARGRAARAAVETAREQVADALGVAPLDVIFTSGGTESDNAAVTGIAWAAREARRGSHLVTTAIEHPAVRDTVAWLAAHAGFQATVVPVEPDGVVDPERLLAAVRDDTVLVSVMAANNEIGTLQPIDVIGPLLAERGVPLHVDAVQAIGKVDLDVAGDHIAALAVSAHKLNGPTGVGVLVLRRDVAAEPVLHGGGQERDVRSGTLNTAGIVGCGAALALTASDAGQQRRRLRALRDRLLDRLLDVEGVTLTGSRERRLPHHVHVAIRGCEGTSLVTALDLAGVCASAGSACAAGAPQLSHVLAAVGADPRAAQLRLTLGRTTTVDEIDRAADLVVDAIHRLRAAGGGYV